jgi:hypothetical protein
MESSFRVHEDGAHLGELDDLVLSYSKGFRRYTEPEFVPHSMRVPDFDECTGLLIKAAKAHGPNRRTALPAGRQALVRGGGKGAGAGAGRARPPPNQVALCPSWTPWTTSSPSQLPTGPTGGWVG